MQTTARAATARGVAIVTDAWDPLGGGREQYVAEISRALAGRGWQVDILAHRVASEDGRLPAVTVHRIGGSADGARALASYRRAHADRPVLATRLTPDATHCQLHSGLYLDAFTAERASFDSSLRRAAFWPTLRLNGWRRQLLRDERRALSPGAGVAVMPFAAATRDAIARRYGSTSARITVLPLGIDRRRFHARDRLARSGPGARLLFAGHNFRLKGLRWAIDALAAVRARGLDARLVVAGGGPARLARDLARRFDVSAAVEYAGAVHPDRMPALYRGSDILLHPTFYDPCPRVVLEALGCGCPVVTTRACGTAELITPGREGFVVADARDVGGLTDAILAAADGRWPAMSEAAARLGAEFDFDRHVAALTEWLTSSH